MQALAEKRTPAGIPGLAARDEHGAVSLMPAQPLRAAPPDPYSQAYMERLKGRIAYLETFPGLSVFLLVLFIWCEGNGTVF